MKKLVALASIVVLGACNQQEAEAPAPVETTAAAPEMKAANGTSPGTYTVTMADGQEGVTITNPDGTYTETDPSGAVEKGTWAVVDGKTCFTADTAGAKPDCWKETPPGADGSFTATSDSGEVVTVKPKAAS